MKARFVVATAALLVLSACDQLGLGGGNETANASANQANGAKDPATNGQQLSDAGVTNSRSLQPVGASGGKPSGGGGSVDPAMLVGRWGDNGDCTKDIQILADGTFTSYTGGRGEWVLNGDELTFTGANGSFTMRLQTVDGNNLIVVNPDGSVGRSQRC